MNILIDLAHPAHVHFFKNAYRIWMEHGHNILLVAREKDVTLQLLQDYGYPHSSLSKMGKGIIGLTWELIQHSAKLLKIARDFQADVILEIGGTFIVHIGKLLRINTCVFYDTEHDKYSNAFVYPLASWICTPSSYKDDLGKKHLRYDGYQELAYLHPNHFLPNPDILSLFNLEKDQTFFILRFVSWSAFHDIGYNGLSTNEKISLIEELNQLGRVLISSEGDLPEVLQPFQFQMSPIHMHDLLYYASMYIGEGATMASEAAMLGTPSVYINPLGSGNIDELVHKYHLIYHLQENPENIETIIELARDKNLKELHQIRRLDMLQEKIDVTAWMVEFVESIGKQSGGI